MRVLRCKSVQGVLKELAVYALVYNLVRRTMLEASRRQGVWRAAASAPPMPCAGCSQPPHRRARK
jgi:hypothetical protein